MLINRRQPDLFQAVFANELFQYLQHRIDLIQRDKFIGLVRLIDMTGAEDNDLVVKGNLISRIHARIESGRKHFVLVDESTNGTFVQRDDGQEIYVRRDSLELTGSGVIGMGRVTSRGMPLAVEYACED